MKFKRPERSRFERLLIVGAGWLCILLGIIGGLLPVLQGWMFTVAGLLILSREYEWAHNMVAWMRRRFPRFAGAMDRAMNDAVRIRDRMLRRSKPESKPPATTPDT